MFFFVEKADSFLWNLLLEGMISQLPVCLPMTG